MKRKSFLKLGTMSALTPLFINAQGYGLQTDTTDHEMMSKLVSINDKQVGIILETLRPENLKLSRYVAYHISMLSAAFSSNTSQYFHDSRLVEKIEILVDFLAKAQTPDGTLNLGNLESPPDTAFVVEILCPGVTILQKGAHKDTVTVLAKLKAILIKAGDALAIGGVHTPNHRWVVSAALAQINALYPNKKYIHRIEEWLSEGVFIDDDGHYPERSGIYSAEENIAFITIARLTSKPALLEPVRKNLLMYFYYIESNGDLVTNDSRRQDQYGAFAKKATLFYMSYRYMAVHDMNSRFAAITKNIESIPSFETDVLVKALFYFMENTMLQQRLPSPATLPDSYQKLFTTSHLLRIKEKNISATLFGGIDWPLIVASGRSNAPDFFSYRNGQAILKYMRLSTSFFSMGYFYSEGIKQVGDTFVLHKKLDIPYYQPLPKDKRNNKGDYKLSPSIDDRFWNKMDFSNRPVSNVKSMEIIITLKKVNGNIELEFDIHGLKGVQVTIEMCFAEGGILKGVTSDTNKNYFLESGMGEYSFGTDIIQFGTGNVSHKNISNLEGERYSTHFGTLRTEGMHVYITGETPFKHTLKFH